MGKSLILSLQNGKLAAAVQDGADVRGEALFPLEEDHSAEIAAMAAGAKFALCPGGVLRPLSAGVYALDAAALADARENRFGPAPANRVMERCAETAERMGIPAYFTEAMSVDELLPLNRIRSHAEVHKYSRGFRSEHFAAMEAALGDIRPEDGNYIVAWIDDLTSVGAYQRGRCLDINDCIGAEGPMGFTSSGDVPCAQLAKYFAAGPMSYEELQEQLLCRSGLLQYLGTAEPEAVDERCAGEPESAAVADAMVYQIAKWIGSSALALHGEVDGIIIAGKAVRCRYLMDGIRRKAERIAPIIAVNDIHMDRWLGRQAMRLGSFASPVKTYGREDAE